MSADQATLDGPPRETAAEPARLDESAMFRLLSGRFPSGSYALLRHVANGTGSRSYRWADAVAMGTWPSRGLDVHGIEIKVSRSDWLEELKSPEKAEEVGAYCDYWWLAVPGKKGEIVRPGEIPHGWGLIRYHGGRFVTDKAAPKLEPKPIDRAFLAAVLRRAQEQMPAEALLAAEYRRGKTDQAAADRESDRERREAVDEERARLRNVIAEFERTSGIKIDRYQPDDVRRVGRLVAEAQRRGAPYFERRLRELGEAARKIADETDRQVRVIDGTSDTCACVRRTFDERPRDDCADCGGTGVVPRREPAAPAGSG